MGMQYKNMNGFKSYRDENLLKGFIQKYDITRWHRCNFRQPLLN